MDGAKEDSQCKLLDAHKLVGSKQRYGKNSGQNSCVKKVAVFEKVAIIEKVVDPTWKRRNIL